MNVLALQRGRVGDILMTTPALRALKARFPQADVTFVCESPFCPVLRSNPDVEFLLPADSDAGLRRQLSTVATLRDRRFDLALDFEGSPWTSLMTAASGATRRIGFRRPRVPFAYTDAVPPGGVTMYAAADKLSLLEPLGIDAKGPSPRPSLALDALAGDWARRTLEGAGIGSAEVLLTLAPGSRARAFSWPLERFAGLLDALAGSHAFQVILFPWSGNKALGSELARLTGVPLFQLDTLPSLPQMAALLDRADLHVGNENAAKHPASALGTATLTLYAPGMRRRWSLPGDPLQAGLEAGEPPEAPSPAPPPGHAPGDVPPIARIAVADAYAALLSLEAYLPRLRSARRPQGVRAGETLEQAPLRPQRGHAPARRAAGQTRGSAASSGGSGA